MNKKFLYILMVLVLVCSLALTACNVDPVKVTITYKYNYEGAPADKVVTVDKDANITLENPSRTGYTFEGWFTDAGCTKAFADKVATVDVTLYAKWTAVHTHSLKYQYSAEKHWQECETCDYATAQEAHDTKGTDGACSVCGYKPTTEDHNHVTSGTYASDATGHWVVCTCGNKVLSGAHDTNGTDGACSVCGYKASVDVEPEFVYYYNAGDWADVYAYCWTPDSLGAYPGTKLAPVAADSKWYSVQIDPTAAGFQFNNGKGGEEERKTADLTIEAGKPYFYNGTWYATQAEAEAAIALPVVNPTLYYYNSQGWEEVRGYSWTPSTLGAWPGTVLEPIEEGSKWYSVVMDANVGGFQFNNGKTADEELKKTPDLTIEAGKPYYYAGTWYATQAEAEAAIALPVVTTYTLKGSFDSWGTGVAFEAKSETEVQILNYAMAANTEFKVVVSVTGQNDEWINTLKSEVTVATLAANGNITVADAGNYNLYFDITTKELWIEKVVEEHEHAYTVAGKNETYHWNQCECGAVDEASKETHDFAEGDCACGQPAPLPPVTLYFYNADGWTAVHAHAWDATNTPVFGAWPGKAATAVEGEEGWYSIELPAEALFAIFNNNGQGAQTGDLTIDTTKPYFYANVWYATLDEAKAAINHEHDFTNGDCACGEKAPVTLYFYNADSWEEVRGYSWTPSTLGAWPGTVLEPIEEGSKWYSVVMDANVGGFQFNNGKTADEELKKTGDLTIETGKAYYLGGTWYATQAEAEATLEHEHAYTVAGKDETHHWNQCECGEVDAISKVEHTYVEGVCSCGATEPVVEEPIVVYYYNSQDWEAVKVHAWNDGGNVTGDWPGKDATAVEGEAGWFSVEIPAGTTGLLFNSGTGSQTADLLVADGPYFYENTGYATLDEAKAEINHEHDFTNGDCSCGEKAPLPPVTLYFYNADGWTAVHAHAWDATNTPVFGAWPGKAATAVEGEEGWYSIELPAEALFVIFNNNGQGAQTGDLTIDTTKPYFYANVWYATLDEAKAAMAQPVTVVYTLCGSFNNWEPDVVLEEGETEGVVELLNQEFTARTEFKVVIYVNGTPEWINKLQDGVTVATLVDLEKEDSNLVVEPGTYSFYFNTETKEINVVLVAEHSHAYNVANKDATHHWNQCVCGAVDEASKEAHDFTEGDCACGEKALEEGESTKIYVDCSACSWFESDNAVLTVYLWNDTENNTWPGVVLAKVEGSNLYEIEWTGENPITGIIVARWNPAQDTEWNRVEVSGFVFNAETPVFTFASDASNGAWSALPVAE